MEKVIKISIRREDPLSRKAPHYQSYEVQSDRDMTVLEVLQEIHSHLDSTLAMRRYRCGRRLCRSCEVRVDGEIVRGCATLLHPGNTYQLEPARPEAVIRDLVFDFDAPSKDPRER